MSNHWTAPDGLFADRNDVAGVFDTIYSRGVWGGGSGAGSDLDNVRHYLGFVQAFVQNNAVRSVVDLGCGDWRSTQYVNWGAAAYHGVDVVPSVIDANRKQFGGRSNVSFSCGNPLDDQFIVPRGDLLIMKDVVQHLSNSNAKKMLGLTAHFKFSLITNDFAATNTDCRNGDTRPLDIRAEPFNLRHAAIVMGFAGKATFLVITPERAGG